MSEVLVPGDEENTNGRAAESGAENGMCPSLLSIAVINAMTRSNWGGKGLFHLTVYSSPLEEARAGAQGRTLELGIEAETMENAIYWFAPHGLLGLNFFSTYMSVHHAVCLVPVEARRGY